MAKSRRQWVRDAGTPSVRRRGNNRGLIVEVFPIGHPERTISFEMDYWQFRDFTAAVRTCAQEDVRCLRSSAESVEKMTQCNEHPKS